MKEKTCLTLALMIAAFSSVHAQNKSLTDKEKHAIHAMYILSESFFDHLYNFLTPGQPKFSSDGQFVEQEFELTPGYYANLGYETHDRKHFRLTHSGDMITGGVVIIGCDKTEFQFKWNEDRIVNINRGPHVWNLEYNSNGLISNIVDAKYSSPTPPGKYGGKWEKISATLEYDGDLKLSSIQKFISLGERNAADNDVAVLSYPTQKKSIRYDATNDVWTVEITRFQPKEKQKEKEKVAGVGQITVVRKPNEIRISKDDMIVKLNDLGKPIVVTSTLKDKKTYYEYEYGLLGAIEKIKMKSYNLDGTFLSQVNAALTYTLKGDGADPNDMCAYKYSNFQQTLNESGEVIEENDMRLIRKKDANGNWGPWGSPFERVSAEELKKREEEKKKSN